MQVIRVHEGRGERGADVDDLFRSSEDHVFSNFVAQVRMHCQVE